MQKSRSRISSCHLRLFAFIRGMEFLFILMACQSVVAAPRLVCDSPKYDFGRVIGQDEIVHEYILRNRGDEPVKISSIKNCCGTQSSIVPMEIHPGSNAVCKTVFKTRNRYGPQDKQILIASNDRKNPYCELRMTGTLLKPVEVSPRLIRLGNLFSDSEISQTITATNLLQESVVLESVQTTVPGLHAKIVGEIPDPAGRAHGAQLQRNWEFRLSSTKPLPVGKLNGQVQLNFSSGTVNVPVIGTVKPIIQVVPEQIRFSARSSKTAERLIMLRSGDGRPFEVLSAKLESGEGSIDTIKLSDNRWQLKMSAIPDSLSSSSSVRVETSCKSQPTITVPLSVR